MKTYFKKILTQIQFNRKKQQSFLEDLASLLSDGVSLKEAIGMVETISHGHTKQIATTMSKTLAEGQSMVNGLTYWFPTTIVEIIRAGESSGTLTETLRSAAKALDQQSHVTTHLLSSLIYPTIVLTLALIMLVIIKNTVLENFSSIKPLSEWPRQGISLYHLAVFIEYGWWALLSFLILISCMIHQFFTNYTGNYRQKIDSYPLMSFYRDTVAARFMQLLGLLINNGIIVKKALQILSFEAEPYLAWHIMMMEYRLSGGIDNIAEVLDTQLLKSDELLRLKIISKGKGFAATLIKLGEQSNQRNQQVAITVGRIAGGIILVLGASVAADIIFGIYAIGSALAR
ncbi:MAG: hypothetical protein A3F17_03355 [Gammaproteobacteria bacterium RIFCSPHIGHO2_12_FULL_41_15]|nr:MAG: hypothetical protein A3F17_03355 [Gammaproteobacteria bacterium RIFCSPHIGHO2_12_FULL_41_15]